MTSRRTGFIFAVFATVLCSCGGARDYSEMSAEQMYLQASELAAKDSRWFSRNSSEAPLEMLKELQVRHAFSPYAPLASVKTADINFDDEKYKTAAEQYAQFIADNPKHEKREHAMLRLAESFYNLRESHKRDQAPCKQAIRWGQLFLSDYPESQSRNGVQSKIDDCLGVIAKSELEIGKFYLKRKEYEAAKRRFVYLAENFPETEAALRSEELLAQIPPEEEWGKPERNWERQLEQKPEEFPEEDER